MTDNKLKQEAEQIAEDIAIKGGFNGSIDVLEFDGRPCFNGRIDTKGLSQIEIKFNPKYDTENPGRIHKVFRDIPRHEIDHRYFRGFKGCPRTPENHTKLIFEPIAEILIPKGFSKEDVHYTANALEDTILHSDLSSGFDLNGINYFFQDVGEHSEDGFGDFYEAHVKLNMFLFGNKKQKKESGKYFHHPERVKEVLENFLRKTGISGLKQKIIVNGKEIEAKDRGKIRAYLNDERNWQEISRIYAEEFSKLMQPGYAMALMNHSGKGTKGREEMQESPRISQEGNEFDREMETNEFRSGRVQEAYSEEQSIPNWIDYFDALDLLYQSLARKLNIKAESFTHQSKMPVYWFGKRSFDPERDNLKHTAFGFDEKGKVELKKKRWHENIPLEFKVNPHGFPEMRFALIDTSGSMKDSPDGRDTGKTSVIPWGDNSKYHYALLGWYGLIEYLKQNHLLSQQSISLANFGDETVIAHGLAEAKKLALKPQFGGTYIDLETARKLFEGNGNLVFTISDGEIGNWGDIRSEFIRLAKKHYYFHLQVGDENEATEYMKRKGLYVETIKGAHDLATKVIDLTDKLYRRN